MQIRVANRQDEPAIRTIVSQTMLEAGKPEVDTAGRDADLANIESHYFWHDGVFLVAEEDGEIVGIAGALRGENDDILELERLVVIPERRRQGIAHQLLQTIQFFAQNSEYRQIIFCPERYGTAAKPPSGFVEDKQRAGCWVRPVERGAYCV